MSFLNSLCNLIFPCLNLFTEPLNQSHGNHEPQDSVSTEVSVLPTSVILEILLKLPTDSIIKCKYVCKSWYNLVSDPYFTNTYLSNHPHNATVVRSEHRTVTYPLDDGSFCFLEFGRNGDVTRTPFTPKAFLDSPTDGIIGITGSCNGILCLVKSPRLENFDSSRDVIYNNQAVCLINPLLGECMLLPDVTSDEYIRDVVYGFGFSTSTNEYKVIRLIMTYIFIFTPEQKMKVCSEILTVGFDRRWRFFEDSSIPRHVFPCGITLNGILHWIGDDGYSGLIVAFDIGEERGSRLAFPQGLRDAPGYMILALWDDCLCLTDNGDENQVDVWIMKQYGVAESWTRDFILESWIPSDVRPHPLIPVMTLRNGDLLMSRSDGQSLMSFDPKMKRCAKLDVFDDEGTISFAFGYAPTFFFPRDL